MALERQMGKTLQQIEHHHKVRYERAMKWAKGKNVLDAACGCGYGTSMLSEVAERVTGWDVGPEAIAHARKHYARPNNSFLQMDLQRDIRGSLFDTIVSLETLEHLDQPVEETIRKFYEILRPGGILVFSHPAHEKRNKNIYHKWFDLDPKVVLNVTKQAGFVVEKSEELWADHKRYSYHMVVARKTVGIKLDVGGGFRPASGYKILDCRDAPGVDYVCPAWETPLEDGSVSEIRARHFLEHLSPKECELTLREWLRIMEPNAFATVTVPNIEFHASQLTMPGKSAYHPTSSNFEHAMAGFYGWHHQGPGFEHKWGYTRASLISTLVSAGFSAILLPSKEHEVIAHARKP